MNLMEIMNQMAQVKVDFKKINFNLNQRLQIHNYIKHLFNMLYLNKQN